MKYFTFGLLSLLLVSQANAAEQNTVAQTDGQSQHQQTTTKTSEKCQSDHTTSSPQQGENHELLKTQFLSKRPYMAKTSK